MKRLVLFALVAAVGCGTSAPPAGPDPPLSVADWKGLPADQKYAPQTLERVRTADPKFAADDGAWDKFLKDTVAPARKKDFPKK